MSTLIQNLDVEVSTPQEKAFIWIHISDLHFGHGREARHRVDQKIVTSEILHDAKRVTGQIGPPDVVFLTGDIAFKANKQEYEQASEWIDNLLSAVEVTREELYIIPGNHDIDRAKALAGFTKESVHKKLREEPRRIDEILSAPEELSQVWTKLEAFAEFAKPFAPPHLTPQEPFWVVERHTPIGQLRIVGLNTTLLSFDDHDDPSNLALGLNQIHRAVHEQPRDALLVVLQHHPPDWLSDGSRLEAVLQSRPHILLCGHIHDQGGHVSSPLHGHSLLRLVAGAGHSDPRYPAEHAYNWGRLSSNGLDYFPRIWVTTHNEFRTDRNKFDNIREDGAVRLTRDQLPFALSKWIPKPEPVTKFLREERPQDPEVTDSADSLPYMAPRDRRYYTGRKNALQTLTETLLQHRSSPAVICGVTGVGGIGKSALAAHFAQVKKDTFPDGVFWASVDSQTPIQVAQVIATTLGRDHEVRGLRDDDQAQAKIRRLLRGKRALLVLDNADHREAAKRIRLMLPNEDTVGVIVTTRNRGLASSLGADLLELESFSLEESLAHFHLVLNDDPRLTDEPEEIPKIARLVGGLPLAIDISVNMLRARPHMPLKEYRQSLAHPVTMAGNPDVVVVVDKSLALLEPHEQEGMVALGACAETGFSIDTAMAVVEMNSQEETRHLLYTLVDLSLVQELADQRFGLHPIVRSITRNRAAIKDADRRHAAYWSQYVKRYSRDLVDDWEHLSPEWEGIRTAWDWSLERVREEHSSEVDKPDPSYDMAADFAFGLRYFVHARGHWQEALDRMPDSVKAAERDKGNPEREFRIRRHLAIILRETGNLEAAAHFNQQNIELTEKANQDDWKGQELEQLGRVRLEQKNYPDAEALLQEALDIAREFDLKRYEGQALNCLVEVHRRQGSLEKAADYCKQVLHIYEELNDAQGVCAVQGHLGTVYHDKRDYERAKFHYASSISMFNMSGRLGVKGHNVQRLGSLLEIMGQEVDALACYVIAARISSLLDISGWEGKSVEKERERLLTRLGPEADTFRVTVNNPETQVLDYAEAHLEKITESILTPDG